METKNIQPKKVVVGALRTSHNKITDDSMPVIDKMMAELSKKGIEANGPMEFIYHGADADMDKEYDLQIAQPIAATNAELEGFEIKDTPEFKCITGVHTGSLNDMMKTYDNIFGELGQKGIQWTDEVREVYQKWVSVSSDENIVEIQVGVN